MHRLTIIETILRDRGPFFNEIRDGVNVREKITSMLISSIAFLAIYGAVLGASHSLPQTLSSTVKLPLLFILTFFICAPSLHFFNVLFGSRQSAAQTIALVLTGISTTSVLLFSLAPITLFFLISSNEYYFYKLLNVVFFAGSGLLGMVFLRQGMRIVTEGEGADGIHTRRLIFAMWVFLYGFVGLQMAWTLSPFIGYPDKPFMLFKQVGGNVYADILESFLQLLGGW